MRAVRVAQFGAEENLKLCTNVPVPKPSCDEVLIQVKAAGINPVDTYVRQGIYDPTLQCPYTPGKDGAGIVMEVGKNVKGFQKGDRVLASLTQTGSYAEYCTVKPQYLCSLDKNLSFAEGAAIGIPYYTAYHSIFNKANTKPGETVLVHGASGAVGIASIQILKAHGCRVIGTAGTPEGMQLVLDQGADRVFNHREKGYMQQMNDEMADGGGIDVILEMLSNINLQADMEIIGKKGRIVIIGCRGDVNINPRLLMKNDVSIIGMVLFNEDDEKVWNTMHAALTAGQRLGWLKPIVAKIYKMDNTVQGHHDVIHNSGTFGKLIIDTEL